MDSNKLLKLIEDAKNERDKYLHGRETSKFLKNSGDVLNLMKTEIESNVLSPLNMNPRVFRAYRDICTVTVKGFEDTDLERAIIKLLRELEIEIPEFKNLGPLKSDFDKQHPI